MKKFLAILLIACTLFSVSALAAETTFAEPFTLFDFGSESRLDDMWKANLLTAWSLTNGQIEENEDSWTLVLTMDPDLEKDNATSIPNLGIANITQMTYGAMGINNGWGTYVPSAWSASKQDWTYASNAEWVGKNQYIKFRLKNLTDNTIVSMLAAQSTSGFGTYQMLMFNISANDTEFQTYIFDGAYANAIGGFSGYGRTNFTDAVKSNTWTQKGEVNRLLFHVFGACGHIYNTDSANFTWKNAKAGDTVEIDYIIFAPTAEIAAEYKSIDEGYVPEETTTTEATTTTTEETTTTTEATTTTTTAKVEETTTTEAVVDETTTTEAVVDETTTTEAVVDETTTTEAVVDETTTTEAVVDETTTTVADGTTTTANGGNNQKDGGFPVWIIIVIVVVIGGGVAAFFVFKK